MWTNNPITWLYRRVLSLIWCMGDSALFTKEVTAVSCVSLCRSKSITYQWTVKLFISIGFIDWPELPKQARFVLAYIGKVFLRFSDCQNAIDISFITPHPTTQKRKKVSFYLSLSCMIVSLYKPGYKWLIKSDVLKSCWSNIKTYWIDCKVWETPTWFVALVCKVVTVCRKSFWQALDDERFN